MAGLATKNNKNKEGYVESRRLTLGLSVSP